MLPNIGSVVFIDGNQAAIVIGHEVAEDGSGETGGLIVGLLAGAQVVEQGNYGAAPGPKAENPPSHVPEAQETSVPTAGAQVVPSAGGQETPETTTPATEQTQTADPLQTDTHERTQDAELGALTERMAAGVPTQPGASPSGPATLAPAAAPPAAGGAAGDPATTPAAPPPPTSSPGDADVSSPPAGEQTTPSQPGAGS